MGADYIEPDLVSTKDGVLVARHENDITDTTDVAEHPEFADRRDHQDDRRRPDHRLVHRGLHPRRAAHAARRRAAARPAAAQHRLRRPVPDPDVRAGARPARPARARTGERVGVYPETKHPTYFRSHRPAAGGASWSTGWTRTVSTARRPVFVQSFETGTCALLDRLTSNKLVQLLDSSGAPYDFVASGDPRTYADLVHAGGAAVHRAVRRRHRPEQGPGHPARRRRATCWIRPRWSTTRTPGPAGARVHVPQRERVPAGRPRRGNDPADHGDAIAEDLLFLSRAWTASSPTSPTPA